MRNDKSEIPMKVLKVISERTIDNPITGAVIGEILGVEWRQVAKCVEGLRFAGFKIGSSKSVPMGYFLARNPEEMISTITRIRQQC